VEQVSDRARRREVQTIISAQMTLLMRAPMARPDEREAVAVAAAFLGRLAGEVNLGRTYGPNDLATLFDMDEK